ncbi:MAG: metal-sensitive transcriptional regulator [Acidobacteriota bacterium]
MLNEASKKKLKARLNRIEGQVAGIRRMIEEGKYCVDILLQISAAQAALGQVGKIVLGRHIETCVFEAMSSGDEIERRTKIEELMEVFSRYGRLDSYQRHHDRPGLRDGDRSGPGGGEL